MPMEEGSNRALESHKLQDKKKTRNPQYSLKIIRTRQHKHQAISRGFGKLAYIHEKIINVIKLELMVQMAMYLCLFPHVTPLASPLEEHSPSLTH